MSIDGMIDVLQAEKAGKTVQRKCANGGWKDVQFGLVNALMGDHEFRVKPEPIEVWVIGPPDKRHDYWYVYKTKEACQAAIDPTETTFQGRPMLFREVIEE